MNDCEDVIRCEIRQGLFDRWFIFGPKDFFTLPMAWSGMQFVPCTKEGLPTGGVQVCNFSSEKEARDYCREAGLEPDTPLL